MKQTLASRNPNKRNPRKPFTEHQAIAFKKSINEFGDLSGLVWNRRTKTLIAGHKRREEFLADNPTVEITETLDKPDAVGTTAWGYVDIRGTRFSYREVDWPKKKELAANLAANQHGAEFEWQGVSGFLKEIKGSDYVTMLGFEPYDIENLLAAEWSPPPVGTMPTKEPGESGNQTDMIVLDGEAREAFNKAKKVMEEKNDLAALKAICERITSRISS